MTLSPSNGLYMTSGEKMVLKIMELILFYENCIYQ